MRQKKYLVGLIGEGIQGSRSPALHEGEGRNLGLFLHYQLIDLARSAHSIADRPLLLDAAELMGFAGLNITHPGKQAVMPLLGELSADAKAIGAANTIVFETESVSVIKPTGQVSRRPFGGRLETSSSHASCSLAPVVQARRWRTPCLRWASAWPKASAQRFPISPVATQRTSTAMPELAPYIKDRVKAKSATIVWGNNDFAKGGRDSMMKALEAQGIKVAADVSTEGGKQIVTATLPPLNPIK